MVRWVRSLVVAVTLVPHAADGGREEVLLWLGGLKCGNAASTDRRRRLRRSESPTCGPSRPPELGPCLPGLIVTLAAVTPPAAVTPLTQK